ncbi:autoinducer binding domain-containing protein [Pseudomonas sp. DG56-2]|uniref:autoinducer binding domain-containing protein n=1 Tax=Pseudomonas sp. DG56-2 TaxID=2320270 RepID=UPI0010A5AA07|nr:autoinducer binding domain-containing protein [Pseudomonas sp. DG56-2]
MNQWRERQLEILLNETDEIKRFELASALAKSLNMEYFSFTACLHSQALHPPVETFNNYPKAWNDRYWQCAYADIDPVFAHCQASALPILWHEEVFQSTPEFRDACCCHGLRFGWSQSHHDVHKNHSILSVARSHTPVSMEEFHNNAGHTLWMCNLMHELMLARQLKMNPPAYQLSHRELEVLKWSAAGKTAGDIACILTLSQSTVHFHIRNFITKMDCTNKAGAIGKAGVDGLLD